MEDKEMIDEILQKIRAYYQFQYNGYDTYIEKSNLVEHIISLCQDAIRHDKTIVAISKLTTEG